MSFKDKTLHCIECKKDYIYTIANQEFQISKGYPNDPVRCPACRRARKNPNTQYEDGARTTSRTGGYFK